LIASQRNVDVPPGSMLVGNALKSRMMAGGLCGALPGKLAGGGACANAAPESHGNHHP
jgi:hypothetical protein